MSRDVTRTHRILWFFFPSYVLVLIASHRFPRLDVTRCHAMSRGVTLNIATPKNQNHMVVLDGHTIFPSNCIGLECSKWWVAVPRIMCYARWLGSKPPESLICLSPKFWGWHQSKAKFKGEGSELAHTSRIQSPDAGMFWSLQDQHAPSHTAGPWRSQNGTWPWLAATNQKIYIYIFIYLFVLGNEGAPNRLNNLIFSFGAALI